MAKKRDFLLKLFLDITKSEMLHFGFWDAGNQVTWESLTDAQEKYTRKILDRIPKNTRTILDVGCGTGAIGHKLQNLGFSVEGVSPDLLQKEVIEKKYGSKFQLYPMKFEELNMGKKYDLILMMESCQYIELAMLFPQCRKLLNEDGTVLISDTFRLSDTKDYKEWHILDKFLSELERNNFEVTYSQDVTLNTVPTVELASKVYQDYVIPISETFLQYFASSIEKKKLYRFAWKIVHQLLKEKINKLSDGIYRRVPRLLDRNNFLEKVKYMIFLAKPRSYSATQN